MSEKAPYERPAVIEYGSLEELTLGSSGCDIDWLFGTNAPGNPWDINLPICGRGGS